jgi:hypothetical protein
MGQGDSEKLVDYLAIQGAEDDGTVCQFKAVPGLCSRIGQPIE